MIPDVTYSEDCYTFNWRDEGIAMVLERFQESRDDIRAELTVTSDHPTHGGQLYFGRLLLMGPRSRADVRIALEKREPDPDWGGMLEQLVTLSLRRYREGAPAVDLWADDFGDGGKYLVRPFIFDNAVNIIYGSGDSGKSLFNLLMAIAVCTGEEVAGVVAERTGPVLYLDWEDSAETHAERLRALCAGLGMELEQGRMIYRRMDASLTEGAREVRKDIARFGVAMVIVDSLGMACGGDPSDAGGIIRTMLAARSLGVPVTAIHHIAKDAKDKSTPYGSVYASNEARMSWLVESERVEDTLTMALTNHKANRGQRHARQSFTFRFESDDLERLTSVRVTPATFGELRQAGKAGKKWLVLDYLRKNGASRAADIATALGMTAANARVVLNRGEGELFVQLKADGVTRWGALTDAQHVSETERNVFREGNETVRDSIVPNVSLPIPNDDEGEEAAPW